MTTKPLNSTTTSAHVYADTAMEVQPLDMPGSDTVTVRFGDYACNVTVFMQPADLRRLRDAIDAHLGDRTAAKVVDLTPEGEALAKRTADAYSAGRYGTTEWAKAASRLLETYSEDEVEAILRSKWTRWAGDNSAADTPTADDICNFVTEYAGKPGYSVAELMA